VTRIRSTRSASSAEAEYPALRALQSFEHSAIGIRERFLTPVIGGGRTIAVLAEPLGEARSTAWVLCHGFGQDQVYMQPFEVPIARALAAQGYPVLRFHGQGYGDSELARESITLAGHVAETIEAADQLMASTSASGLGFIGIRVGGTVACLAADRVGADMLAIWDPVVKGRSFMQ